MDTFLILIALLAGLFNLGVLVHWWINRRRHVSDETSSIPGFSIEVDCRTCGKINRVPSRRLLDRPRCGRCKVRLMPGRRVVLCREVPMAAPLSAALDATWRDEDRLWQCLADHVAQETRTRAEAPPAPPPKVN